MDICALLSSKALLFQRCDQGESASAAGMRIDVEGSSDVVEAFPDEEETDAAIAIGGRQDRFRVEADAVIGDGDSDTIVLPPHVYAHVCGPSVLAHIDQQLPH